jgi:alpha-mannosidase
VNDRDVPAGEAHHGYTDQCDHNFRYALYPHPGGPVEAGVTQAGYEFNFPLRRLETGHHKGEYQDGISFLHVEPASMVIETLKKAEDGEGWIVRLYEAGGSSARARLAFAFPIQHAQEANLLEAPSGPPLSIQDQAVELLFHPFEVKTVRIVPGTN